ncbi:MarR family winged helix-turn-helix transcriptional regulator [Saccharopolyspora dendranthemae]|uniref:DNA-binding MarR family transcriptional regulator n=1 Tax=Saccharopolyspora dendranthemae TaxID=1181886 RepID=A0A561U0R0_9PSEU|nr:MarR family transcriptional regulator [Saccharopolyspora dendranthemae]TWF92948.1 DNA-binding MarR family transcriptional regulator [Saccharopolyspora dendranthemae]
MTGAAAEKRRAPDSSAETTPSPTDLLAQLTQVSRQADRHLESVLAEFGLHTWEYDVLAALRHDGEPYEMCPGTIGGRLGVSNSAMTNRITRLEKSGLVGRHLSPTNRRIVIIRLTDTGLDLVDRALSAHHEAARHVLDRIPAEDAASLGHLLGELGTALDAS